MQLTPFGSDNIISEHIANVDLKTYFVGFDIDNNGKKFYRINQLVDVLQNVIPEFAFGHHVGKEIGITEVTKILRDSANAIYKIKEFAETKKIYQDGGYILDDDLSKKYLKRGEFGELILHLLLRDFNETIPLLSKIYFKDAYSSTVHGFDAVHIHPVEKSLWLGESKIYVDGRSGIRALIGDVKSHIQRDYLNDEFTIISKKLKVLDNIEEKDYWLRLMDSTTSLTKILQSITIPLLCTYSSGVFTKYDDETLPQFISDYEKEVIELKEYFDTKNVHPLKTNLNIVLLLFPVKSKNELVRKMHNKLSKLQGI